MPVVMGIAFVVVIAAVVLVAMGRGDGLSAERGDYLPLDLGPVSATDVALLRPPAGLWGYNRQATDEAMELIAESIRQRDVRIVALEQLVTDLSREPATPLSSPYVAARHRRSALDPAATDAAAAGLRPEPEVTAPWPDPETSSSWADQETTAPWPEPQVTAPWPDPETGASWADTDVTAPWADPQVTAPWSAESVSSAEPARPAGQAPADGDGDGDAGLSGAPGQPYD